MAMVILSVALLAIVGAFNASTIAVARARTASGALAVADRQMETYRSLQNCAIWLDQWLMPAAGSQYALDTPSYNGDAASSPQIPYWNAGGSAEPQSWATDATLGSSFGPQTNLASCAYTSGTSTQALPLTSTQNVDTLGMVTPPPSAVKPEQTVTGPDGQRYTVDTYIVLVQPSGGEWTKQVTVVVRDPIDSSKVLAREVSVFDPTAGA